MAYKFKNIEKKWQGFWSKNKTFKVTENTAKPKFYILDMFPYPSGAGLHVGHPLGYIASDIYARYKRLNGFNVLHPMGYDAFGLPAEQYAIQTGQHPAITTNTNLNRYREQLDKIGFCFDWSREIKTCEPSYYKWTQWAFTEMFNSFYHLDKKQVRPIEELISHFESFGCPNTQAAHETHEDFTGEDWKSFLDQKKELILQHYRMAYLADTPVNWCPMLGTVLANDEVKDGFSVRGGHPVEQKVMKQWSLRISAYAERLLEGLDRIEWSDSIKEIQRNWIGRSEGAEILFSVKDSDLKLDVFTTRPDTIFGVTFMVLAPESDLVSSITTKEQSKPIEKYLEACKKKSQRERMADVKTVSGCFTGGHCIHPFTGKEIPIWVGDYVLGGYGTGAIMAVAAHDSRDHAFAKHFNLPIIPVIEGEGSDKVQEESYDAKRGKCINSDFLNGLEVSEAINNVIDKIVELGFGKKQINFRLRDAIFSRQRYWGEPFPVYFKDGIPHMLEESDLPLELPEVDAYLPTEEGDPPLGRAKNWKTKDGHPLELSTMPGFAGSSAYYLRYMDPHNEKEFVSKKANDYWQDVDLYVGGNEHATGHLIYARFWNKFLFDLGLVCKDEPFQKLVNQGMIQGRSNFVYRLKSQKNKFVSLGLRDQYETQEIHVDVNIVANDELDMEAFKNWRPEFKDAEFITEEGIYRCGWTIEKMSKSMFNVVNPDSIVEDYGADTLRLYEMFLGPLEQSKPWNTNGIEGVYRFLIKFWNLIHKDELFKVSGDEATPEELKILHTCIKKVSEDMENFSFNTSVSAFMIAINDLGKIKSAKASVIRPLVIMLSPFAPHFAEEIWEKLGETTTVMDAKWPKFEDKLLIENTHKYPVSFNGKMRFLYELPIDLSKEEIEKSVLEYEETKKWIEGKSVKKMIIVPKKIVNIVLG